MAIPTVAVNTTNCDANTDSMTAARVDILDLIQKFNQLIAELSATPAVGDIPIVNADGTLHVTATAATSATNADTVDSRHASATAGANIIPIANSAGKISNSFLNTGSGNGIDADKLDGQEGSVYARLASPTFSGTPTAPTAAVGTNNTQIATTAFVAAASGSTYSHAATGYEKFNGGLEIKWGTCSGTTSIAVTFASPFAAACVYVGLMPANAAAGNIMNVGSGFTSDAFFERYISAKTASGFTLTTSPSTPGSQSFAWFAIGY